MYISENYSDWDFIRTLLNHLGYHLGRGIKVGRITMHVTKTVHVTNILSSQTPTGLAWYVCSPYIVD
jgi:hypothetical protein